MRGRAEDEHPPGLLRLSARFRRRGILDLFGLLFGDFLQAGSKTGRRRKQASEHAESRRFHVEPPGRGICTEDRCLPKYSGVAVFFEVAAC
jgi:hypothetical protein